MFCSKCAAPVDPNAAFCTACGASITGGMRQQTPPPNPQFQQPQHHQQPRPNPSQPHRNFLPGKNYAQGKTPFVALILSFFIPGLGQFYNGDIKKGLMMFIGSILGAIFTAGLVSLGLWIWGLIDGYKVADQQTPLWD